MEKFSLKAAGFGDLERELELTRVLLERVPEDKLNWRPHEKSWTLGELAGHLANLPTWQTEMLSQAGIDIEASNPSQPAPESTGEILKRFDENAGVLRESFAETDDSALGEDWTLRGGERVLWVRPRAAVLREWGISHIIHHRGQLTIYLRLLGVPLPPIYGPTADEKPPGG